MEELLRNFIDHLNVNIDRNLAKEVSDYVDYVFNIKNSKEFDNDEIEHNVKSLIANFFKQCFDDGENNFDKISKNLYNAYIENDDSNLIQAVKTFISFYSKFQEMKLRSLLYKWRINGGNGAEKENNAKVKKNENIPISIQEYDYHKSSKRNKEADIKSKTKSKIDVFNKLYMNAYKKQDERLLNDEIKRISEMDECTFQPKIGSKNKIKK